MIVDHEAFLFSAVVSQSESSRLFANEITDAEVRLSGQAEKVLNILDYTFIPYEHETLPSAALGWGAGGEVAVSDSDESGLQTAEPFFQIYAGLVQVPEVTFLHGRSGYIHFRLPSEPLFTQWFRSFRQLVQKRYQI
jgi:putative peptide zinc metalloprotease protein